MSDSRVIRSKKYVYLCGLLCRLRNFGNAVRLAVEVISDQTVEVVRHGSVVDSALAVEVQRHAFAHLGTDQLGAFAVVCHEIRRKKPRPEPGQRMPTRRRRLAP